jgi:hypothetical protein
LTIAGRPWGWTGVRRSGDSIPSQLSLEPQQVHFVPGLGDLVLVDQEDGGGGEGDFAAGGGDSEELALVGAGPLLVGGDAVVLGDGDQDLVAEVGEGLEEGVDRGLLAGAPRNSLLWTKSSVRRRSQAVPSFWLIASS